MVTSVFCITTMCDQYLGLIIPATMYKDKYDELGLGRNMLSRTMEDSGTLWSPLVPWSSCGAYHTATLGVPTLQYIPFCFMNIINPLLALITVAYGGNILYADGSRTTIFRRFRKGNGPAGAPPRPTRRPWPPWPASGASRSNPLCKGSVNHADQGNPAQAPALGEAGGGRAGRGHRGL